jgi:rubrerythrin
MTEKKTPQNLMQAFVGEAKAYFRLLAYARKADEEGYPQIAVLFRAIAKAESAHARNHFALMESVGTTEENLKRSFEKETFVNEVAYPQFLKDAWAEEDKNAIWFLTRARNSEERHAKLYKQALVDMMSERDSEFYVCSYCGWVEEGGAPDQCPNCTNPAEFYERVK